MLILESRTQSAHMQLPSKKFPEINAILALALFLSGVEGCRRAAKLRDPFMPEQIFFNSMVIGQPTRSGPPAWGVWREANNLTL